MVLPGLEPVASEEIEQSLGGEIKRTGPGFVVFRLPEIEPTVLDLRTTEDVFLLAWGTDELTYRAGDLEEIRRWTSREVDWARLLQIHHRLRPKPRGKPTYRLVAQMSGVHGYRRVDARNALARGLAGKLPQSWRHAEENAAVEVWLTIHNATAVCGLRLSDRTMRHRTYKMEHVAASLRPTLAAALIRLAGPRRGKVLLDPMCGAGTILTEHLAQQSRSYSPIAWGGDIRPAALRAARANVRKLGGAFLAQWDATRLPLADHTADCLVSNPPFGKQLGRPGDIRVLYRRSAREFGRVVRPGGRIVLLVSDLGALKEAAKKAGWKSLKQVPLRVLGQRAVATVWATA
jgi:23S rRNA G2445 N2-methylase RlmL